MLSRGCVGAYILNLLRIFKRFSTSVEVPQMVGEALHHPRQLVKKRNESYRELSSESNYDRPIAWGVDIHMSTTSFNAP